MSAPPRLGDPRSKSPDALKRLILAGRSELPEGKRLRSMGHRLGFPAGARLASGTTIKGAAGSGLLGSAGKIGVAVVLTLCAGAGALATHNVAKRRRTVVAAAPASESAPALESAPAPALAPALASESAPALASESAPALASESAPALASESAPAPAPALASESAPALAPAPAREARIIASVVASRSETEFSLLEQAQRALRTEPQRALDLADRDAAESPLGALAQEREVIAIEALEKLGRGRDARARARRFFRTFPGSAHGPRIAALLDFDGFDAGVHNP